MPIYSYQALKAGKEIIKGEVTASNLKDARDVIRKMGLVPTQISEYVDTKSKKGQTVASLSLAEKMPASWSPDGSRLTETGITLTVKAAWKLAGKN